MDLLHAIVHDLRKEAQQPATVKLRNSLLGASPHLDALAEGLHAVYRKKSTKGFGVFSDNVERSRFSVHLKTFLDNPTNINFVEFSKHSMSILQDRISSENLAKGGYVLFIFFSDGDAKYLLVVVLRQKVGSAITDDLELNKAQHLEVDKLHTGCQIDISTWLQNDDSQYISFVKGKTTAQTPKYFLNSIGCSEYADSAHQTNELIRAVDDYATLHKFDYCKRQELKQKVYDFCESKESVLLDILSTIVSEENPNEFLEFINTGGYKVGNGFEPHKKQLKKLREIKATGEGIHLKFPSSMLGKRISNVGNDIIIHDAPKSMLDRLREERE